MPLSVKPGCFFGEDGNMDQALLLGIKLRIARDIIGGTQAEWARKFGMTLPEYKKIEEAVNAPDGEKTLKMVQGGLKGIKPYDARTRISRDVVEMLLPRVQKEGE